MNRVVRVLLVVALAGGMLVVPAAHADTFKVRATRDNDWNPSFRHIVRGDRIKWKNPARLGRSHDIKAYGGNWRKYEFLSPGEATKKKFRRRGTYRYRCTIHSNLSSGNCSGMCGVIHVGRR